MQLNIQPQSISVGSPTTLLNGPATYTPQPRIHVRSVQVTNAGTSGAIEWSISKNGNPIASGNTATTSTTIVAVDTVLETSDSLSGICISSGTLEVGISADIHF
jgi:hypothetical protein